jgi:hypothetical protein
VRSELEEEERHRGGPGKALNIEVSAAALGCLFRLASMRASNWQVSLALLAFLRMPR